ncbi:malectin domain-containing carbohydrate-binding protein [Tunturiibacter lichenicola]|uniref:malectin domain-containing carbohydrate-binding protein n=1 Tax=Tunturiibacter lichenicola TaxID=2051959 RepID=UPI003D9BBF0B
MNQGIRSFALPLSLVCLLAAITPAHAQDITMWKADPQHTGLNSNETVLTPAIVNDSTKFAPLFFQKLDGQVYGAPLFMSAATLSRLPGSFADNKSHNVVYVVTQHDSVYAFDADADPLGANTSGNDSAPLWHTSLLEPNAQFGTPTTVPSSDAAGNDISPEFGITTTPVIDPASGTLFVVSLIKFPGQSLNNLYRQELHALDLKTGKDKVAPFVLDANLTFKGFAVSNSSASDHDPVVAPTGEIPFAPLHEHLRGAMTFDAKNNIVYLVYASHSDEQRYYGMVLGFDGSTLNLTHSFVTTPNGATKLDPSTHNGLNNGGGEGGIWQGGASAALDENQNIIFVTGNGPFDQDPSSGSMDWGETALKLPAAMAGQQQYQLAMSDTSSYFTPSNWFTLNSGGGSIPGDSDLGAGGPLLLPAQQGDHPHMMMFGGKAGVWYLIDRDVLGGILQNDAQALQELAEPRAPQLTITPSYFNGAVYYAPSGSPMVKRLLVYDNVNNVTTISTTPIVGTGGNVNAKGSSPFITSSGTSNGIVWGLDGNVHAYDANTMQRLGTAFNNDITAPDGSGRCQTTKFSTMIVANAHAYYTCYSGTTEGFLVVAGLKSAAAATPAAPTGLSAQTISSTVINLNWTNNAATDPSLAGFHIFRATSGSGPFIQLSLTAQGNSFSDSTAVPNTQYFYRVTAFNSVGDSGPSNTVQATTYPTYAQSGLVGYWPMEDATGNTVSDATGNGHTGSLASDGEALYTPAGYINGGWNFHGTKIPDSITVQDSPSLDFTATQSFTLATWVQVDAVTGIEQPIVLKSANNGNVYGLLVNANNHFAMRGPSGDVAGPVVNAAKWTHVAMVQNGPAGTRTLYVNGQAIVQGVAQAANGAGALEWGEEDLPAGSNQVQFGFQGTIDETRLYNTALSASQIADLLPVTLLDANSLLSSGSQDQLGTTLFPITAPVSEARVSQTPGSYTVVAHFAKAVTGFAASLTQQSGAAATGTVGAITYDGTRTVVSIALSNVADGQKLNLHLSGIVAADNSSVVPGSADVALTVLEGDVTGDGVVNGADVSLESSNITNAAVAPGNARFDINGDGSLTSADTALVSGRIVGGQTPPAPPTLSQTTGSSSVALSWTASATATSYTVLRGTSSGGETQLISNLTGTSYTDNGVTAGSTYFYTVEAVAGSVASKASNEVQATIPGQAPTQTAIVQIDSGSTAAVNPFAADEFFQGGSVTGTVGVSIDMSKVKNAAPMAVYQSNRYGNFTYIIPNLTTGTAYAVRLHFAETYWSASNSRVFDVIANQGISSQQTLLSNFDIYQTAGGKDVAYSQDFLVTATNGQIVLTFKTDKDNALVSGIEVLTTTAVPPPPPTTDDLVAIDSGSTAAVNTFAADEFFQGGSVTGVGVSIDMSKVKNAAPIAVYQSNRHGNFTYTIPNLTTGTAYTVRLHFAETYWSAFNSRIFDVIANQGLSSQQTLLSNFDIYQTAGGKDVAYSQDFLVTATNGQIVLTFKTDKDNALVSGIEVLKP